MWNLLTYLLFQNTIRTKPIIYIDYLKRHRCSRYKVLYGVNDLQTMHLCAIIPARCNARRIILKETEIILRFIICIEVFERSNSICKICRTILQSKQYYVYASLLTLV